MWAYTKEEADWLKSKSGKKPNWFKRRWNSYLENRKVRARNMAIERILRTAQPSMRKEIIAIISRDESR